MKQIEIMYKLQEIENSIIMEEQKLKDLESPKEINKRIEEHKGVKSSLGEHEKKVDEYNKTLKELESDFQVIEEKTLELKGKMYDGNITDLKQLGMMLKEQEKFDSKGLEINEEMETKMEELEAVGDETAGLKKKDKEMYKEIREMLKDRNEAKKHGELELEKLSLEKEKILKLISEENLRTYDYIKSKKNNPVAILNGDICSGCHMDLPVMTISNINKNELVMCSNCGRILFKL